MDLIWILRLAILAAIALVVLIVVLAIINGKKPPSRFKKDWKRDRKAANAALTKKTENDRPEKVENFNIKA